MCARPRSSSSSSRPSRWLGEPPAPLHTEEGAHGMGAHVTLLYPFTDTSLLDARRLREVREVARRVRGVRLLARAALPLSRRTPRVLCLRPEPDAPFRAMTQRARRSLSRSIQPYGGKYADPIPHATVAIARRRPCSTEIERDASPARCRSPRARPRRRCRARRDRLWRVASACRSLAEPLAQQRGARSTSPAPIASSTSPGSARRARYAAPCSTVGIHAASTPRSESASTTSLPLTPSTGSSRAA